MHSVESWGDGSFLKDLTSAVYNDSENVSRLNVTAMLLVKLHDVVVAVGMHVKNITSENEYDVSIVPQSHRLCKISKNPIEKFMRSLGIDEYTNLTYDCPLRKGFYYISGYTLEDDMFPTTPPIGNYKYQLEVIAKGSPTKNSRMIRFLNLTVEGKVLRD